MKAPRSIADAVSYNPAFLTLCWDVETPDGVVSVYSQNRALEIARAAWPELAGGRITDPMEAPEVWVDCPECCGEGAIEIWESVSKWSIDPPCAHAVPCRACNGTGGMICEAEGD